MERHVKILGILYIISGSLFLVGALLSYFLITMGGIISGDETAIFVTEIVGIAIASFLLLISVPGIIGGIGLLKFKRWAKILVLIIGILNLLNIPIGTILGIYTIWVLMNNETDQVFAREKANPEFSS